MIRLDMPQGSPEWLDARCGIPTASRFDQILTPVTHKRSKSADGYLNELIAERLLGASIDTHANEAMLRGIDLQDQAHKYYEFQRDCTAELVGHCLRNDGMAGCSPDALVGDNGGLEIKCREAKGHVALMRAVSSGDDVPREYTLQIQGSLWITERDWWDFLGYHDALESVLIRVHRDEELISKIETEVLRFAATLKHETDRLGNRFDIAV